MATPTINLNVGQSVPITANILDAYGTAVPAGSITYISNDLNVATLATQGSFITGTNPVNSLSTNIVYGVANGSTTIQIIVNGTLIQLVDVVVNTNPPSSIQVIVGTPSP